MWFYYTYFCAVSVPKYDIPDFPVRLDGIDD